MQMQPKLCRLFIVLFPLLLSACSAAPPESRRGVPRTFFVTDYGAVGDGKTMNADAFAKTMAACAADGGGIVRVPSGIYLTGPIQLVSNMDFHLDAGATVLFSRNMDDYPLFATRYEGRPTYRCRSPITGENLQNISITGDGTIDGQGEVWRPLKKSKVPNDLWKKMTASGGVVDAKQQMWWPSAISKSGAKSLQKLIASTQPTVIQDYLPYRDLLRPTMVELTNCHNVRLEGPTFRDSANWNIHLLLSDDIVVRNVHIWNPLYAQNGDGIDIDSCRNVSLTDSTIFAGDDDICLKSGRDEAGRALGRPTENVTINNCTIGWGHGGFVIGSEMSGGVRNVTVSNCIMTGTDAGLRFKTVRGRGGVVENIQINNIEMKDITGTAITFNMYYQVKKPATQPAADPDVPPEPAANAALDMEEPPSKPVTDATPQFRQIHISNVHCEGAKQAIEMRGLPEMPIEQVTIDNTRIVAKHGGVLIDAKAVTFRDVSIKADSPIKVRNLSNTIMERVAGISDADSSATTTTGDSK
jgi:polygalacturonase